ncbi:uncharacterized protein LOC117565367 isoform X1 [Drosophila albomicans]|uniref:Uncharacterized protein LOC117565367 isoform X1 n=1 Tax=Drosophila albomicans TaxID=7291 RepID=A0A9C6WCK6_DROAB|nr:uncharacterized protein LOC117565367 isoform X1 [Drosophila albomicans]
MKKVTGCYVNSVNFKLQRICRLVINTILLITRRYRKSSNQTDQAKMSKSKRMFKINKMNSNNEVISLFVSDPLQFN